MEMYLLYRETSIGRFPLAFVQVLCVQQAFTNHLLIYLQATSRYMYSFLSTIQAVVWEG